MRLLDWIVLGAFVAFSLVFGIVRGRRSRSLSAYVLADRTMPWYAVALSVMATQASAITFVSTTGQGFADGMRFVQFYFGLPIAMVVLCAVAVPVYHRLNVFTAYEYLERRFDPKTRVLVAAIFLVQRGLAASLSLYAPALILSVVLGWEMRVTIWIMGVTVVVYAALGGVKGVNWNDFQQFLIIMVGMVAALGVTLYRLPSDVSIADAVSLAGVMGRLNVVQTAFDWNDRYTLWSGLLGGFFLALSYFGTDQSQVQRYLTARSVGQSRLGLLFNGLAKVPMQFFILFVGVMVFVFYQFVMPPLFFNPQEEARVRAGPRAEDYRRLEAAYESSHEEKRARIGEWLAASRADDDAAESEARARLLSAQRENATIREQAVDLIVESDASANPNDTNYVFLVFVTRYLPAGLVGLVIVVVFAATMSSTASELTALATCSVVDIYKRHLRPAASDAHFVRVSRLATAGWGLFAIAVSERASRLGTLVEAVNILGSLFYGTVLGVFVLAFALRRITGTAAFVGALAGEALVLTLFFTTDISYLWYNVLGTAAVVLAALLWSAVRGHLPPSLRAEVPSERR